MTTELRTAGPHSPAYTRDVAATLAEAVRVLNYATRHGEAGLAYPGDAYDLLGALTTATERLPQLLSQIAAFLRDQTLTSNLADAGDSRDPAYMAELACARLRCEAVTWASALDRALRNAQNAIAGLHVKTGA